MTIFASRQPGRRGTAVVPTPARPLLVEPLEDRVTPVSYLAQGPGPLFDGQVENIAPFEEAAINNAVAGAIETIAPHPLNPDIVYVGTVNGGVWKTTNATAPSPDWSPTIDFLPSLSIGALAFDPDDPDNQTLIAGVASTSTFGQGSAPIGLLRTDDGGDTWELFAESIQGLNVTGLAPRGSTLVVSSADPLPLFGGGGLQGGVYRSIDDGQTFQRVSLTDGSLTGLPAGEALELASDPREGRILYTAITTDRFGFGSSGVYRSTDTGANWTKVSSFTMDSLIGSADSVRIGVGDNNNVFVAIATGSDVTGVFYSPTGGLGGFTQLDDPTTMEDGMPIGLNLDPNDPQIALAVDFTNDSVVYLGGGSQPGPFPNSIGAELSSGRVFRGDADNTPGSQWVHMTHSDDVGGPGAGTFSDSAPHAGSRDLVFRADDQLLQADNGGIYRRLNPREDIGDWFSLNGNLQIAEAYAVAYDDNTNSILAGSQGIGVQSQELGAAVDGGGIWQVITPGSGGDVAVDTTSTPGLSIRYVSDQFLNNFEVIILNSNGLEVDRFIPTLNLTGGSSTPQFGRITPVVLNAIDPTRLIIGAQNSHYESLDQGDFITELAPGRGLGANSPASVVYGGRSSNVNNEDLLIFGSGDQILLRLNFLDSLVELENYPGFTVNALNVDPDDFRALYVADSSGNIYVSRDTGSTWENVTGNLLTLGVGTIQVLEYIPGPTGVDAIVIGTDSGVYMSPVDDLGNWVEWGTNLPNAPVFDLDYNRSDDVLVVGTLGRGVWSLPNAATQITDPVIGPDDFAGIFGDQTEGNQFRLVRNGNFVDVFIDVEPFMQDGQLIDEVLSQSLVASVLTSINFVGTNADDSLRIDRSGGDFAEMAISFAGQEALTGDQLAFVGSNGESLEITLDLDGSGSGNFDGSPLTFTGIQSIDIDAAIDAVQLLLPAGVNTAALEEDGVGGNNKSQLRSNEDRFPLVNFRSPEQSFAVIGGVDTSILVDLRESVATGEFAVTAETIEVNRYQGTGTLALSASGSITEAGVDVSPEVTTTRLSINSGNLVVLDTAVTELELSSTTAGPVQITNQTGLLIVDSGIIQTGGTPLSILGEGGRLQVSAPVDLGTSILTASGVGPPDDIRFTQLGELRIAVNGLTPGGLTGHGQFLTRRGVEINGATLRISGQFRPVAGSDGHLVILRNSGTGLTEGQFNGLPPGGTVNVNGTPGFIVYDFDADADGANNDVAILFITPPTADAGTVYNVGEGGSVELDGSGSRGPEGTSDELTFLWDLDGDGIFGETGPAASRGDEVGIQPTFLAANLDGPTSVPVLLQVTDPFARSATAQALVVVNNEPPMIDPGGPYQVVADGTLTLTPTITDPGDQVLDIVWDLDGDGIFGETGAAATRGDEVGINPTFSATGLSAGQAFTVQVRASDDDGGSTTTMFDIAIIPGDPTMPPPVMPPPGMPPVNPPVTPPGMPMRPEGVPSISAVGTDVGGGPLVVVFNADGSERFRFFAYDPSLRGGVRVAVADVNGDGTADIVTGAGSGGGPHVKAFNGVDGTELLSYFAYDSSFTGGVFVAAGDVNDDGFADIVTGAGAGGGPHVRLFSGQDGSELSNFFAYDPTVRIGVNIGVDAIANTVITGVGVGGGPRAQVWDAQTGMQLADLFVFDPTSRAGVQVTVGDLDGDGRNEYVFAPAQGTGSLNVLAGFGTRLFTDDTGGPLFPDVAPLTNLLTIPPSVLFEEVAPDNLRIASIDVEGDHRAELLVARNFAGAPGSIRILDGFSGIFEGEFTPISEFLGGIFVGGTD